MKRFVFTCGDVNGIGPEIVIKALNRITKGRDKKQFIFICPKNIFNEVSKITKPTFDYSFSNSIGNFSNNKVIVINLKDVKPKWGSSSKEAGQSSFDSIKLSFDLLLKRKLMQLLLHQSLKQASILPELISRDIQKCMPNGAMKKQSPGIISIM